MPRFVASPLPPLFAAVAVPFSLLLVLAACSNLGLGGDDPGGDDDAIGDDDTAPTDDDATDDDDDATGDDDDATGDDDDATGDDDDGTPPDDDVTPTEGAEITVTPDPVDFGTVDLGVTDSASLAVKNDGESNLTISSMLISGDAAFNYSSISLPKILTPGQSLGLTVTFTPTSGGNHSADLVIGSDDPDEGTYNASLEGYGDGPVSDDDVTPPDDDDATPPGDDDDATPPTGADIQVTPMSLDYGTVSSGISRNFEIKNVGSGTLSVSGVSFSEGAASAGSMSFSGVPGSLSAGASATVTASWSPGNITFGLIGGGSCLDALDGSAVQVTSNSPGETLVEVSLEGCCDGTGYDICTAANVITTFACIATAEDILDFLGCLF